MFGFLKRRKKPGGERVICALGDGDYLTEHQAFEGVLITGATGSGKTSGPARAVIESCLRMGMGCLCLCAKVEEADRMEALARAAGRALDVVRMFPGGPWKMDLLDCAARMPGGTENAAQLLDMVVEVGSRKQSHSTEQFWKLGGQRMLRRSIPVVLAATGTCSVTDVARFMTSAPTAPWMVEPSTEQQQAAARKWAEGSFWMKCFWAIGEKGVAPPDLEHCWGFWAREFPNYGDKTQSGLQATVVNCLDKFMVGDVAATFSSGVTNVAPVALEQGKILLADYPILKWQESGQFAQCAAKALCLRSLLARDPRESTLPVLVVQDEAQLFALPGLDSMVQGVARQSRVINLVITQNLPMLATALGGDHTRQEVAGWVANFQTKVFCQNGCKDTNAFASALIGNFKDWFVSGSPSREPFDAVGDLFGMPRRGGGLSFSEHWHPQVTPDEFSTLRKGGAANGLTVEAIAYQGGREFSNGKTWKKARFSQRG